MKLRRVVLFVVVSSLLASLSLAVGPHFDGATGDFVLLQLRLPRLLVGALVGATLGISGAAFQALFNNALATPDTVGTSAGATLGALLVLALNASGGVLGVSLLTAAAFGGALLTTLLVSGLASSGRLSKNDVLLITPFSGASLIGLLALARPLQNLALGEDLARAQGVNVARLRVSVLLLASLGVAACVAWCGPIAFVGLIVPHLVRLLVGPGLRLLLPLSFIGGGAFLVTCDAVARVALPGRELPVGVITAALGAPALVFLVSRARRE